MARDWTTTGRTILPGRSIPIGYLRGAAFEPEEGRATRLRFLSVGKGSGVFSRDGHAFPFRAPAFFCLDELEHAGLECSDPSDNLFVYFHPSILRADLDFDRLRGERRAGLPLDAQRDAFWLNPFSVRYDPEDGIVYPGALLAKRVLGLAERMIAEAEHQPTAWWPCRTRSFLIEMLFALSSELDEQGTFDEMPGVLDDPMIRRLVIALNARYAESLTIDALASELGTNRTTLQSRFKEATGTTIVDYLQTIRLDIARALLADTMLTVDEIAERSGYASTTGFSRAFRSRYALSPKEYRATRGKALLAE